jgi:hypothetical protein
MKSKANPITFIIMIAAFVILGVIQHNYYKKHNINYNYPRHYKEVFESYLPDGYEVTSKWQKNITDSYYDTIYGSDSLNNGHTYGRVKYYYIEYDNGTNIFLSSLAENIYGADEAVALAIKEAMTDNYKSLLRTEIKSTYAKCGTLITYVDFNCSDSDILNNKYGINLNEMDWQTYSDLPITITYKMIPNRDNTEETLTDLMEDLISLTKENLNNDDIEVSYYFESND